MIKSRLFPMLILLMLALGFSGAGRVSAVRLKDATGDQPVLDFPNTITFHAVIDGPDKITSVVLEYGDQEETCGQVIARAYPKFTPGKSVTVDWTWDMRQSGSLPPGARVWWQWRTTDESGTGIVSSRKTVLWLDGSHPWQTLARGDIRLHWYGNSQGFAQDLLDTAYNGLARVENDAGLSTDQPIDLYIYSDTSDMKDAILYEPAWTGGMAFPEHNIVILGISPSDLSWGRKAEVHELTHVLVGHLTFSCLGGVPTWLNEGLAVYSEGQLDPAAQQQLDNSIRNDTLLTVRSLSGRFSEISDKASLSYSESYSIVKFLIDSHGRDKVTALLVSLRDGSTVDEALTSVYGFDIEGLEDAWRAGIGAKARTLEANPTAISTPTTVPTIVPISGAPLAITPTPFDFPTPSPAETSGNGPPLSLTLTLLFTCCALGLVVGVLVIGFIIAMQKRKEENNDKGS